MDKQRIEDIGSGGGATETEIANAGKANTGEAAAMASGDDGIKHSGGHPEYDPDPGPDADGTEDKEKTAFSTDAKVHEPRYPFRPSGLVEPCGFDVDDCVDLKVDEHIIVVQVVACENGRCIGVLQTISSFIQDDLLLPIGCYVSFSKENVFRIR